jgi:hypothetical protein
MPLRRWIAAALFALLTVPAQAAEQFPTRQITLVVGGDLGDQTWLSRSLFRKQRAHRHRGAAPGRFLNTPDHHNETARDVRPGCPLLALSGHSATAVWSPLSRGKADIDQPMLIDLYL